MIDGAKIAIYYAFLISIILICICEIQSQKIQQYTVQHQFAARMNETSNIKRELIKEEEIVIEDNTSDNLSTYIYNFSDDEIYLIQRTVETECHGGDFLSKTHVASVIINRLYDSELRFGCSITSIITSPNQFAYFRTEIDQTTIEAVDYVLTCGDTANGCLWFHSYNDLGSFYGEYIFSDDIGHHFYR